MTLDGLYMPTLRTPLNLLTSQALPFRALGLPNRDCLHRVPLPFCLGTERA